MTSYVSAHARPREPVRPQGSGAGTPADRARRRLRGLRATLAALTAFMAVTAIQGAVFVVPSIPRAWLHRGVIAPFADATIPALALGIACGGSALLALAGVLARPRFGAVAATCAGALMVGFELVEMAVVGFTPVQDPRTPAAWLQPFYIALGAAIAVLGARLWRRLPRAHPVTLRPPRSA